MFKKLGREVTMPRLQNLLAAVLLLALAEARNRGHPVKRANDLAFKPPSVSVRGDLKSRSPVESSPAEGSSSATETSMDDEFSWLDPMIQRQLWAAAGGERATPHQLSKRAPARIGEPLYTGGCFACNAILLIG